MNVKRKRFLLVGWIISLVASTGFFASFFVMHATRTFFNNIALVSVYFLCFSFFLTGFAVCFINWRFSRETERSIKAENFYNLGKSNNVFDYNLFSARVKKLRKKMAKGQTSFVVTFTASHISMMKNSSRNPAVIELNGYLADFITEYFTFSKSVGLDKISFCYYHGQFVLFILASEDQVREIIDVIESEIYRIVQDNAVKLFVQPFFGFASFRAGETLQMVLDNAFLARDLSEKNFDSITYYADSYRKTASKSEILEIKEAIENDEIVVYYQPKFNLASKTFISSEALVRWNSKKYGLVSPARFIEKAELGGLIHALDMCVFEKVCHDLGEMKKRNKRMISVSVNFSMYEFYSPTFLEDVDRIIKASDINPSFIEIEITETTSQANPFLAISIVKKVKEYGLKILMDDFGIGYSNLSTLSKVPFDTVKIDKTFIDGIISDLKTREIIRFLISLCKTNGMEVIAEGVDKQEQVEILKKLKCDTIQGYYYSEPLPREEFEQFLIDNPFEKIGDVKAQEQEKEDKK